MKDNLIEELLKENAMFSKVAVLEKCKTSKEMIETLEEIVRKTKSEKEVI